MDSRRLHLQAYKVGGPHASLWQPRRHRPETVRTGAKSGWCVQGREHTETSRSGGENVAEGCG